MGWLVHFLLCVLCICTHLQSQVFVKLNIPSLFITVVNFQCNTQNKNHSGFKCGLLSFYSLKFHIAVICSIRIHFERHNYVLIA